MASLTVEKYGFQSWMIFQSLQEIAGKAESDLTLYIEPGAIFRDLKPDRLSDEADPFFR